MFRSTDTHTPRKRSILVFWAGLVLSAASLFLFRRVLVWDVWPDVMTLYALFLTLYGNRRGRYLPCMLLGLTRDILSAGPIGTYAILYGLLHRLLAPRRKSIYRYNILTQMAVAGVTVVVVNLSYHGMLVLAGSGIGWSLALGRCLRMGLIAAPLMPVLVLGMRWVISRLRIERIPGNAYNI